MWHVGALCCLCNFSVSPIILKLKAYWEKNATPRGFHGAVGGEGRCLGRCVWWLRHTGKVLTSPGPFAMRFLTRRGSDPYGRRGGLSEDAGQRRPVPSLWFSAPVLHRTLWAPR